jgi:hypothetical protein
MYNNLYLGGAILFHTHDPKGRENSKHSPSGNSTVKTPQADLSPSFIMQLQNTIGNRGTMQYLQSFDSLPSKPIQAKTREKPVILNRQSDNQAVQRVVMNSSNKPYSRIETSSIYKLYKRDTDEARLIDLMTKHEDLDNFYTVKGTELIPFSKPGEPSADQADGGGASKGGRTSYKRAVKKGESPPISGGRVPRSGKPKPRTDVMVPGRDPLPDFVAKYKRKGIPKRVDTGLRKREGGDTSRSDHSATFGGIEHLEAKVNMSSLGLSRNHIIADSNIARIFGSAIETATTPEALESFNRFITSTAGPDHKESKEAKASFDSALELKAKNKRSHAIAALTRAIDKVSVGAGNIRADEAKTNTAILHGADYPLSEGRMTESAEKAFHSTHDLARNKVITHKEAFAMTSPAMHVTKDDKGILHGNYLSSSTSSSRSATGRRWGDTQDPDTLRAPRSKPPVRASRSEPRELPSSRERRPDLPEIDTPYKVKVKKKRKGKAKVKGKAKGGFGGRKKRKKE